MVIYQHYSRTSRDLMVSALIAELERRLQGDRAFALRSPHVAYLVAARADEAARLGVATGVKAFGKWVDEHQDEIRACGM